MHRNFCSDYLSVRWCTRLRDALIEMQSVAAISTGAIAFGARGVGDRASCSRSQVFAGKGRSEAAYTVVRRTPPDITTDQKYMSMSYFEHSELACDSPKMP